MPVKSVSDVFKFTWMFISDIAHVIILSSRSLRHYNKYERKTGDIKIVKFED